MQVLVINYLIYIKTIKSLPRLNDKTKLYLFISAGSKNKVAFYFYSLTINYVRKYERDL